MSKISFYNCMENHGVDLSNKRLNKIVNKLADDTSLDEGLNIAKGLIENYFLSNGISKEVIDLIEKSQEVKNGN